MTGDSSLSLKNGFWVFAESEFNTCITDEHIVNTSAVSFDDRYLTAAGVRVAKRSGGSDATVSASGKAFVERVYSVAGTHLRGKRVGDSLQSSPSKPRPSSMIPR